MQPATAGHTQLPATFKKAHPGRGVLWGSVLGVGVAAVAILLKVIPLDLVWTAIVVAAGVVIGLLWSTLGPAKQPPGEPPWRPSDHVAGRPDWDATQGPLSEPSRRRVPTAPTADPVHITPLDVEPIDVDPPPPRVDPRDQ